MDNKTLNGTLGEISVIKSLILEGLEVYTSFNGKGSIDVLAYSPETQKILRVEVKSCTQKNNSSYIVEIKRVRSNKTENVIKHFDQSAQDVLAVYIVELDTVLFYDSLDIKTKAQLSVRFDSIEELKNKTVRNIMEDRCSGS